MAIKITAATTQCQGLPMGGSMQISVTPSKPLSGITEHAHG